MRAFAVISLFLVATLAFSQEDSTKREWITLQGYIKNMQIASFGSTPRNMVLDNLVHNRMNFRLYPTKKNTELGIEFRNRLFLGATPKSVPGGYGKVLDVDPGFVDMSYVIVDDSSLVLLSQIDRAWFRWTNEKWAITAGRQRVNWGTNLFWNSNDLFNAYSLVDFDYEERPGSDALRIQRFMGMNSAEVVVKPGKDSSDWIGGAKYQFNKWGYDFQVLGAWWNTDYALGVGWAGNIKGAGFKGEVTYFVPQENWNDTSGQMSASISADYVFGNQLFLTGGILFNSGGLDSSLGTATNVFTTPLSAKNMMPTKYNIIASVNYPLTPLSGAGITTIYSPIVNTAFFMPTYSYSMSDNWEIAVFGQSVWLDTGKFQNIGNGVYVRVKGSF